MMYWQWIEQATEAVRDEADKVGWCVQSWRDAPTGSRYMRLVHRRGFGVKVRISNHPHRTREGVFSLVRPRRRGDLGDVAAVRGFLQRTAQAKCVVMK